MGIYAVIKPYQICLSITAIELKCLIDSHYLAQILHIMLTDLLFNRGAYHGHETYHILYMIRVRRHLHIVYEYSMCILSKIRCNKTQCLISDPYICIVPYLRPSPKKYAGQLCFLRLLLFMALHCSMV